MIKRALRGVCAFLGYSILLVLYVGAAIGGLVIWAYYMEATPK